MSNKSASSAADLPALDALLSGAHTTVVVLPSDHRQQATNRTLERQLREATGPDGRIVLERLIAVVSRHYDSTDEERRSVVRSMQMMSDEAQALTREIREQTASQLQAIVDHVKDVILSVDESGHIETFNPTGERVFGVSQPEILGRRIDYLIPEAGAQGDIGSYLERLASRIEDTQADLAAHETECRRDNGQQFPAEIAVSKTRINRRTVYILCLRDTTERHNAEQSMRESEARYKTLVENAPEAIVVLDVELGRFVDVNENAARFFKMERAALLAIGPEQTSPPVQADGTPSFGPARGHIARALAGEKPVFEWLHRDAFGRDIPCEVRLVRLPSSTRQLVRGSITDITERKRADLIAAGERRLFERMSSNAQLSVTLEMIIGVIEQVSPDLHGCLSLLSADARTLSPAVAPRLASSFVNDMDGIAVGPRNGSCAAAIYLGRQVIVADIAKDALWDGAREVASRQGWRACWSTPIVVSDGHVVGTLAVYRKQPGTPGRRDFELLARMTQLAGIAIERRRAEDALRASEAKFRGLFENVVEGVYQSTREGRLTSVNPAFVKMLGYDSAEELCELPSSSVLYVDPTDRDKFRRELDAHGEVRNAEYRLRRKDGSIIVVLESGRLVRDEGGRIVACEGTIADITERKKAETAVFEEKERAQVTLQSIGDAVITTDAAGRIDYLNPVAETLTGWSNAEAQTRPIAEVLNLVHEASREVSENPVMRCLREARVIGVSDLTVLVGRGGGEIAIQDSAAPIRDRGGSVIGAVMVFHDVSKERRLRRALSYQASHDALTGLINRREFENRLSDAVASARGNANLKHVLIYVDLDQFKLVNDTCGHPAGDRLLKQITGLLQTRIRTNDTLARLGGDEFGILLENCSPEQAIKVADTLRQAIREYRFVWNDAAMNVGASIGIVEINNDTESVASIMSAADVACYAAKDQGRNRVHVYEQDKVPERHREMQWVSRLTRAIEADRFELFFQPIVPIGTNRDAHPHFELMLRLREEDGTLVQPIEFIPAAERYNVMPSIDRWVVERALSTLAHHKSDTEQLFFTLAINLSGTSLNDERFLEFLIAQLAVHDLTPGALCFEITETAAIANLANVVYFMRELKARGCSFSLDDFGSGLSSFTYLKTLPVDYLKIDGQFVQGVTSDAIDRSMVEAISQIGRSMGIKTVAERVETAEVLAELARLGVGFAQGFYIAAPDSVAHFPYRLSRAPQQPRGAAPQRS